MVRGGAGPTCDITLTSTLSGAMTPFPTSGCPLSSQEGCHGSYSARHNHGHGLNEAFSGDELVEAEDLTGGHVETPLWHDTCEQTAKEKPRGSHGAGGGGGVDPHRKAELGWPHSSHMSLGQPLGWAEPWAGEMEGETSACFCTLQDSRSLGPTFIGGLLAASFPCPFSWLPCSEFSDRRGG